MMKTRSSVILVVLVFLGFLFFDYGAAFNYTVRYYDPVVDHDEVLAAYWIRDNLPVGRDVVYAADLFASELIMGVTASPCVIGGDWSAVSASEVGRFLDCQTIFTGSSAQVAHDLCRKWGVDYVFLSNRMVELSFYGYAWLQISKEGFDKFFDSPSHFSLVYSSAAPVYGEEGIWILKVLS